MAVVVCSCDAYADLWHPFFTLFFRYWPDCPYAVYLVTNEQTFGDPRVKTVTTGPDTDWSQMMGQALTEIDEEYVLVLMEDYLFKNRVKTSVVEALHSYTQSSEAGYLRLRAIPGPDIPTVDNQTVGRIQRGSPYRVSLQAAIWDRRVFLSLLQPGESPWQFELRGSRRSDLINAAFLSVIKETDAPIDYLATGVVKGRWLREAVALCRQEGIAIDLDRRPIESALQERRREIVYRILDSPIGRMVEKLRARENI